MALTFKLKEANSNTEIDLVYDAASNASYQMYQGSQTLDGSLKPFFHKPDNAPPQLIKLVPELRTAVFRVNIEGDDSDNKADDTLNKINALERWVGGDSQQAARYWTDGDVNRIELHCSIDGATNTTIFPVVYGEPSFFSALWNVFGEDNQMAHNATIRLFVAEYGEGDPFVLHNDLASSPHFIEDSNSDGLADGWSNVGTPTTSINSIQWLVGGQSQQIITDTSTNEGVQSDLVTATASSNIVAYVWIRGTGNTVTINLVDGASTSIDTATFNPSSPTGYDKTAVGAAGNTWYRYVVSGTNSAANARLIVSRTAAGATQATTFRIDAAYLHVGSATAPDGWCSTSAIQNRYDPTGASAATEARINYIDVWGIPGDADAIIDTEIDLDSTTDAASQVVASRTDGKQLAAKLTHWIESEDFSHGASDWTDTADANRTGGSYSRLSLSTALDTMSYSFSSDDEPHLFNKPVRPFILCRMSNASNTLVLSVTAGGLTRYTSEELSVQTLNQWSLVDAGVINIPEALDTDDFIQNSTSYSLLLEGGGSAGDIDVDAVLLLPTEQLFFGDFSSAGDLRYILGSKQIYYPEFGSDLILRPHTGSLWHCASGNRTTRFIYTFHGDTGATVEDHSISRTADISVRITPRTRHLLGTS